MTDVPALTDVLVVADVLAMTAMMFLYSGWRFHVLMLTIEKIHRHFSSCKIYLFKFKIWYVLASHILVLATGLAEKCNYP